MVVGWAQNLRIEPHGRDVPVKPRQSSCGCPSPVARRITSHVRREYDPAEAEKVWVGEMMQLGFTLAHLGLEDAHGDSTART
jgi:hypothetical protein